MHIYIYIIYIYIFPIFEKNVFYLTKYLRALEKAAVYLQFIKHVKKKNFKITLYGCHLI